MSAIRVFEDEVYKLQRSKGWDRNTAFERVKQTNHQLYTAMVNERDRTVGEYDRLINEKVAMGLDRQTASRQVREAITNNVTSPGTPAHTMMSVDGQGLTTNGSKSDLPRLGLRPNAPEEMIRIYRVAEQVELTPEIAALVVRSMIQQRQVAGGADFNSAREHLEKHRPEIWNMALKAQPKFIATK